MKRWTLERISDGTELRTERHADDWLPDESFLANQTAKGNRFVVTVAPSAKPADTATHTHTLNSTPGITVKTLGSATYYEAKKGWTQVEKSNAQKAEDDLTNGYYVDPEGYYLAAEQVDRDNWHMLRDHYKELLDLGLVTDDTLVTFVDISGTPRQVTLSRFRQIIVGLGNWYLQKWFDINS